MHFRSWRHADNDADSDATGRVGSWTAPRLPNLIGSDLTYFRRSLSLTGLASRAGSRHATNVKVRVRALSQLRIVSETIQNGREHFITNRIARASNPCGSEWQFVHHAAGRHIEPDISHPGNGHA